MVSRNTWVFDLEANGLLTEATHVWCGVFKNISTNQVRKFTPNQVPQMLSFMDTCSTLIGHNVIGYDFPLLKKLYGYDYKGEKIDTVLMSRLQDPKRRLPFNCPNKKAKPHSVEAWGYRVGRGKPEHNDWGVFSEAMLHRCTEDVHIQHLIYEELLKEGEGFNWGNAHKLTHKLFSVLQEQEQYGWLVDREYMDKCISLLTHFIERIDKTLLPRLPLVLEIKETKKGGEVGYIKKPFLKSGKYSASVVTWMELHGITESIVRGPFTRINYRRLDLSKNVETKNFLLELGWEPDQWNYKTDSFGKKEKDEQGNLIKTSPKLSHDDPFIGITSGLGKLIAKRVQALHRRSSIVGWTELVREDGRIASRVSGLAATGRAKHSGIVNVPGSESFFGKQMRKCFVCKDGYKIVGTDSAGCQNRMLAARVGDEFFTKTLLEGKKEDKTSIHFVNQKAIKDHTGIDVSYGNSKNLNYAFMFGASDSKLGSIIGKHKEAGAKIREALLGVAPGFAELVESLTEEWKSNAKTRNVKTKWGYRVEYYNGWVTGLDGRPIFIESEHQILVYVLQSDEAIMMSAAYCMLYKRAEARGWKHGKEWGFLCWMHDEYQCEVREDLCEEFAKLAEKCIEDAGTFFKIQCPHQGESDIGENWYETH